MTVMFINIKYRKYLILFFLFFLSFVFSLSACIGTNSPENPSADKTVIIHSSFPQWSLGDAVYNNPTIAYGVILEKAEYAEVPDFVEIPPEDIDGSHYYRKVTVEVKQGLKNCEAGDIITYWEPGGKTEDGTTYEQRGFQKAEIGEKALLFLNKYDISCWFFPIEDKEGNVSIPKDFMIEEKYSELTDIPEPDPKDLNAELPMEEYLDKVEKVVREQAQ